MRRKEAASEERETELERDVRDEVLEEEQRELMGTAIE